MKTSLKIEELAMFLLGIFLFTELHISWWWFVGLFLAPDIGMLGYLFNPKIGAVTYNIFHHKGVAVGLYLLGTVSENEILQFVGILLFSHASFDRTLGYGLKYNSGFKNTHLGKIG
ncbi:DUF4260 domain-containing protein [Galbibacter mesophilus]|uniref:DUF4260 domain-containing protein n=1 Tax=Galbibacter mesophilus TaxID=379069 RepID=UPI00191D7318|nr:DUF4260 domain-containing protein [Galbibacter mesophilus]MCM5662111.1 DUF4260 domain-containing protein [Galbibacter mesophilus]